MRSRKGIFHQKSIPPKTINQWDGRYANDPRENMKRSMKWYKRECEDRIEWNEWNGWMERMCLEEIPQNFACLCLTCGNQSESCSMLEESQEVTSYRDTCCGLNVDWRFKSWDQWRHCILNVFVRVELHHNYL